MFTFLNIQKHKEWNSTSPEEATDLHHDHESQFGSNNVPVLHTEVILVRVTWRIPEISIPEWKQTIIVYFSFSFHIFIVKYFQVFAVRFGTRLVISPAHADIAGPEGFIIWSALFCEVCSVKDRQWTVDEALHSVRRAVGIGTHRKAPVIHKPWNHVRGERDNGSLQRRYTHAHAHIVTRPMLFLHYTRTH